MRRELSSDSGASYSSDGHWPMKAKRAQSAPNHADRGLLIAGGDARDSPKPRVAPGARVLLTEEERELAVRYLPLARQLSRRLYGTSPTLPEDLHTTACIALAEAARSYDPSRGVGFGTYARHRIRAALRDFSDCLPVATRGERLADRG